MDLRKEVHSRSGPFRKVRDVYGNNMEDMPNLRNQRAPENIEEILKYNRNRNAGNRIRSIVFNSLMVIAAGIFVLFLLLFFSGYLDVYTS
ncbi:MAG: hypothetical protein AAF149_00980 [Bacteroidota bacterium]